MPQAQPQRPGHRPCAPAEPWEEDSGKHPWPSPQAHSVRSQGHRGSPAPADEWWWEDPRWEVCEPMSWALVLAKLSTCLESFQRMKKAYQSTVFYRLTEGPWILKLPSFLKKKKNPVFWLHVKTHFKCYSCKLERCDTMRPRQMGVLSVT